MKDLNYYRCHGCGATLMNGSMAHHICPNVHNLGQPAIPSFDEWYAAKQGMTWEAKCNSWPIGAAMEDLSRAMRDYITDVARGQA